MTHQNNSNIQAEASALMLQAVQAITENSRQEAQAVHAGTEVYNMTTGLFPCVCVAMYETILSPTVFEQNMNDGEEEFYYNTVDFGDWKKDLTKVAQEYLNDEVIDSLKNYGLINIEAMSIWSPNYYNFHQDELNIKVTMRHDWQTIMREKIASWRGRKDVERFIGENWHSYSGYINLMPESLDEVLTEDDEERQLAAYLTLAMMVEGSLKEADDVMEDLFYRMDDFSDYSRVNVVEEYYGDQDEAQELLDLWEDDLRWNELYWDLFEKIGQPWSHDDSSSHLEGIKDPCFEWQADSEGKKLLFWAVRQKLTVEDLYSMAA